MTRKPMGYLFAMFALMFCIPASADSVLQIWDCELDDDKTRADVEAASAAWLAAAKTVEGGADFEVTHEYAAVGDDDPEDFNFVLIVPNMAAWGAFIDAYPGSAAAEADEAWSEVAECDESELLFSVDIG